MQSVGDGVVVVGDRVGRTHDASQTRAAMSPTWPQLPRTFRSSVSRRVQVQVAMFRVECMGTEDHGYLVENRDYRVYITEKIV